MNNPCYEIWLYKQQKQQGISLDDASGQCPYKWYKRWWVNRHIGTDRSLHILYVYIYIVNSMTGFLYLMWQGSPRKEIGWEWRFVVWVHFFPQTTRVKSDAKSQECHSVGFYYISSDDLWPFHLFVSCHNPAIKGAILQGYMKLWHDPVVLTQPTMHALLIWQMFNLCIPNMENS